MKSRLMIFGEFVAPPLFLLIFGLIFRLNYQNLIPMGFQWDEASYAYNAYSLMTTGKDEWGRNWPLFLEAFGDFKPALLSYLMIFFIFIVWNFRTKRKITGDFTVSCW